MTARIRSPHRSRRSRRSGFSVTARVVTVLFLLVGITGMGGRASAPGAAAQVGGPPRPQCLSPDDASQAALYTGSGASRQIRPYNPFRMARWPCNFPDSFRTTLLYPDAIVLLRGGDVVREVPFLAYRDVVSLDEVARLVADGEFVSTTDDGIVTIDSAFIQMPGTSMTISAPTREVRLTARPHVFLGGQYATARFEGVTVTSWDGALGVPDTVLEDGRGFVVYEHASHLEVVSSTMQYLGSDRSGGSYGVAWMSGTTGFAAGSTFAYNFFGTYTNGVHGVEFHNNVLRDNVFYGLDPHTFSTGLVMEGNEAYDNGSHGIIVSEYVTDSVIRGNHSHHNQGNGIVLDRLSNRNLVEGNLSEDNGRDGIVVLDSGQSQIVGNTSRRNRVGVRVSLDSAYDVLVKDNVIDDNVVGVEAYGGARDVVIDGNTVTNSADTGVIIDAPRTQVVDTTISGSRIGLDVRTVASVDSVRIDDVRIGVAAGEFAILTAQGVDVTADEVALRRHRHADVSGARLEPHAPRRELVMGPQPTWKRVLPFIGATAIALAVLLELARVVRERGQASGTPPPSVWNTG